MTNAPTPKTTAELLGVLDDVRARVAAGDSFEGSLEYLMPYDEEGVLVEGADFMVRAAYRVGNSQGQGGMRLVGEQKEQAAPLLVVDKATGAWVSGGPLTGEESCRVAASVMPGWDAALVDTLYGAWMRADGEAVAVAFEGGGATVTEGTPRPGEDWVRVSGARLDRLRAAAVGGDLDVHSLVALAVDNLLDGMGGRG
jgi:hypothetical protein